MNAKTMAIWTWGHRPFVMGGDVNYILKAEAPVVSRFKVRGFTVACVEGPPGRYRCAECVTGAIVTSDYGTPKEACNAAKGDLKSGNVSDMKKQIEDAKYQVKSRGHAVKPAAEFWAMLPS